MQQDLQDGLVEPREELICIRIGKGHGWSDLEDVVMWTIRADQNATLAHSIHNSIGFLRGRFAIAHQLDAEKQSRAAHITDQRMLQRSQTFE